MNRNIQQAFRNSLGDYKIIEAMCFGDVSGLGFVHQISVKLHLETGTMIGTLQLRNAMRLGKWN